MFLQGNPVAFKARLRVLEADDLDWLDNAEIVPMVAVLGIVVTHHAAIVR